MIVGQHYQNAYVTRDLEAALERFAAAAGTREAIRFDAEVEAWTPAGQRRMHSRLAFVWVGGLQYELIEPVSGAVDLYREALPADDSLRFHHACARVAEWAPFRERVAREGHRVVLEGGGDALRYLYLDMRPLLGHYLEYVWMTDERWGQIGGR